MFLKPWPMCAHISHLIKIRYLQVVLTPVLPPPTYKDVERQLKRDRAVVTPEDMAEMRRKRRCPVTGKPINNVFFYR